LVVPYLPRPIPRVTILCFDGGVNSDVKQPAVTKGRGAQYNPANRFDKIHWAPHEDLTDEPGEQIDPKTEIFDDATRSILTRNDSPDVGFDVSVNPYRGCEHGCVYCYARPTHEYLGLSAGLDFESKLFAKLHAADLLRGELAKKNWQPSPILLSGVTDCYQPIERQLRLTRACLEVLAECRQPVTIVTKSHLVERDIDLLSRLHEFGAASVTLSVTTLDAELAAKLEPRASRPVRRLSAIRKLADAGIPVGVNVAPLIPGLTDHEIPAILRACSDHGATFASYVIVRLPLAVAPLFENWLAAYFPDRKEKVLGRLRSMRGGKLNDPRFGSRMRGEGVFAEQIRSFFALSARRAGLSREWPTLRGDAFIRPDVGDQLSLF
jgi:DNA repair photolyase